MYVGRYVNYVLFLSYCDQILFFSRDFGKNPQILIFMKIRLLVTDFFHADKRTDGRTHRLFEANSRFSQFCLCA